MATRLSQLAMTHAVTNFVSGYMAEQITAARLEDGYFLTGAPIKVGINFEYASFARGEGITIPNTLTSPNDPVGAVLSFGGTKTTGTLDQHRGTTDWFKVDADVRDADLLLNLQDAAMRGTQALVTGRLQRILSAASTAAGSATIIDISDNDDPIADIQSVVLDVLKACAGMAGVRVLIGAGAFQKITALPKFQSRISGGATVNMPSTPTEAQVATAIGYGVQVRQCLAVFNSAAAGQTVSGSFLLDDDIYVAAVNPSPSRQDPAALKVFEGDGANGFSPTFYAHPNGAHEAATWGWMEKVVAPNASAIKRLTVQA